MADSRIDVYHNLSIMLNAGMPVLRALQNVQKFGRFGRLFKQIEPQVAAGTTLSDIAQRDPRNFQSLDRALIAVGEQTGQSAEMFEALSQWYAFRQRLSRTMRTGLMLPIFYIHVASILLPVPGFALGGWDAGIYFRGMLTVLAIFYLPAVAILGIIHLTPRQGMLRYIFDSIVLKLPMIGKGVRELSLSRYCKTFAITYKAGVPILECARMATESVCNAVMRNRLIGAYEMARSGEEMSKGFSRFLPSEFVALWQVGEESGELDDSASRLGNMHAENAERIFTLVSKMLPFGIYLLVMAFIVYAIFKAYMKIYSGLSI